MTNETEAPERIWAWKYQGQHTEGQWRSSYGACPTASYHCQEYTRADPSDARIAELEAKLAKAQSCIEDVHKDCKLRSVKGVVPLGFSCWRNICTTIAELKGGE